MQSNWPFANPQEVDVITLDRILRGESSLRLVTHDDDDDADDWQFLDGEQVFEEDAVLLTLGEMVDFDPSLRALADLPRGWFAWRAGPDQPWSRGAGEPPADLFE